MPRTTATHDVLGPDSGPVRTCVGCGRRDRAPLLVPMTASEGDIRVDFIRGENRGRGVHVHPKAPCITGAAQKGLARSLRRQVRISRADLSAKVLEGAKQLAAESLTRAMKGGALRPSGAGLHVVASDAQSTSVETRAAISQGRALCFGTRKELGGLLGVGEADLAVVESGALALRLRRAAAVHTALAGSEVG